MIYLKTANKIETIEEVFNELFSFKTSFRLKSATTYKDEDCLEIECEESKFRSADDVVEIVQTYFPETTEKEIFYKLLHHIIC